MNLLQKVLQFQTQGNARISVQEDCLIHMRSGQVINSSGALIEIKSAFDRKDWWGWLLLTLAKLMRHVLPVYKDKEGISDSTINIFIPTYQNNYFHFVNDYLPAVLDIHRAISPVKFKLYSFDQDLHLNWKQEYFDHLKPCLVRTPQDTFNSLKLTPVKRLYIFEEYLGLIQANRLDTRKRIASLFSDDERRNTHHPKFVFLTRRLCKKNRSIVNLQEVEQLFEKHDFYIADFNGKSVAAQAEILRETQVIFAVHGAAVTNIIFANRLKYLVEFFPKNYSAKCYRYLAIQNGVNYRKIDWPVEHHGFFVDLSKLKHILDEFTVSMDKELNI